MSKLPELTLTKAGAAMLAKTPIGSEIPVTKWRIGTGKLPDGEDPRDRTQLVNPVRELPIASVKNDGNQCLIKGQLVNSEMEAFTWRETGLYATDPDDGEILYAYGYEADGAEIPAGATQLREVEFGVELVFDNAANVTAVIHKTLVFATLSDLEQTKADAVEEALEQITTSPVAEELTDSDAFATVTAAGIKRTPLSLLKQVFGKLFAPSGYGLGESHGGPIPGDDFNNAIQNGWYSCKGSEANGPDLGNAQYTVGAILFVKSNRMDYTKEQTLHLGTSGQQGLTLRRYYHNALKKWYPWEWVNPPLQPGKEYRTTERWGDAYTPVYIKRISCGKGPTAGAKIEVAHNISNLEYIVDIGGCLTIGGIQAITLPFHKTDVNYGNLYANYENIIVAAGEADLSAYTDTQVWLKYTKTTDGAG